MQIIKSFSRIARRTLTVPILANMSTTTPAPNLPGLDLPLDYYAKMGTDAVFPTALDNGKLEDGYCKFVFTFLQAISWSICSWLVTSLPIQTLRELAMQHIMNHITDKPGWESKVCCAVSWVLVPALLKGRTGQISIRFQEALSIQWCLIHTRFCIIIRELQWIIYFLITPNVAVALS